MSRKLPVILTYFAQNADQHHLNYLEEEYDCIYQEWREADTDKYNPINVQYLPNNGKMASVERIISDITAYRERIVLLHFSGHAGNEEIFLNDGTGNADGLAGLLAQHTRDSLKLVFLNGCSTKGQVEVLFKHQIPVVIATQCNVGDRVAKEFARYFYDVLTQNGYSIQEAYTHALNAVRTNGALATMLPGTAVETAEVYRAGGLKTTVPTGDIWKLYVREGDEAVVKDPDWWHLPGSDEGPKEVISLEKAYTCDRVPNTRVFQEFFKKHGRTKAVHHYLVVDEDALSPQGLSFKLVYEHITCDRQNRFAYHCDPNGASYTDDFVILDRFDDAAGIANKVYAKLLDEVTKRRRPDWNRFEDFYELNVVREKDFVIVFIRIDETELPGVAGAVRDFMTQSTAYAAAHPPAHSEKQAKLLFFWHVVVAKAPESAGLAGWWRGLLDGAKPDTRMVCVEQFGNLYNTKDPAASTVWVLNENVRPLPIPHEDDIKDWLIKNDFLPGRHLTKLADFANDVRVLELEFRDLIQQKRTSGIASRP